MGKFSILDIMQFVGGGSMLTLAVAVFKYVRGEREGRIALTHEIRELRKDLGHVDTPVATGLAARVVKIEAELQSIRDWAVREGYDGRL